MMKGNIMLNSLILLLALTCPGCDDKDSQTVNICKYKVCQCLEGKECICKGNCHCNKKDIFGQTIRPCPGVKQECDTECLCKVKDGKCSCNGKFEDCKCKDCRCTDKHTTEKCFNKKDQYKWRSWSCTKCDFVIDLYPDKETGRTVVQLHSDKKNHIVVSYADFGKTYRVRVSYGN